jgi:hypothetical protein
MCGVQIASADTVGVPGTQTCFGQRISHGSSDHQLTPKERAAGLQEIVDSGDPDALAFFGPAVSVQEMIKFVQINCSDDPIITTPLRTRAGPSRPMASLWGGNGRSSESVPGLSRRRAFILASVVDASASRRPMAPPVGLMRVRGSTGQRHHAGHVAQCRYWTTKPDASSMTV